MRELSVPVPVVGTRRTRAARTVGFAALVLGAVAALTLAGGPASGQEGEPAPEPPPEPTTTTTQAPPSTILFGDGDFGIIPPGAQPPGAPPPGEEGPPPEGEPPAEGELELPEELAVVVLPDPTPGLNAALAAIDVSAAERRLAETVLPMIGAHQRSEHALAVRHAALAERRAADLRVEAARALVGELAVNVLMYGDPAGLEPLATPETLDELRDRALRDVIAGHVHDVFRGALASQARALEVEQAATAALVAAQREEHGFERAHVEARVGLEEAMARAREARNQVGPAILGPSVLDAGDLVAWYRTFYSADPPMASITALVDTYLAVGAEEGVTGDIAFAQAILETGGFRSGHAQGFNFAGIGAYDHCAPACGFRFADLESGVRAHIHLLRAYADPGLTSAQLAASPNPLVAPERVGVRGCCQRWTALTGVWATDTQYDRKVLGIYRLMVETARAIDRQQQ
jgi:hypothetical protein